MQFFRFGFIDSGLSAVEWHSRCDIDHLGSVRLATKLRCGFEESGSEEPNHKEPHEHSWS